MALVDSLLTAMVRADGDALVMHVGERPIVVSGARTIDLSTHGMNLGAMVGMLGQLLSGDALAALKEFGAVEHSLPARGDDRFSVVAARSGDDIWIEIRRRRESAAETSAPESESTPPQPVIVLSDPADVERGPTATHAVEPTPDESLTEEPAYHTEVPIEPVAEVPVERVAETSVEPVAEVPVEPVAEASVEPAAMPASVSPMVEPLPEPAEPTGEVPPQEPASPSIPELEPMEVHAGTASLDEVAEPELVADVPDVHTEAGVEVLVSEVEPEPVTMAGANEVESEAETAVAETLLPAIAPVLPEPVVVPTVEAEEVVTMEAAAEHRAEPVLETSLPEEVPALQVLASAGASAYPVSSVAPGAPMEPARHVGPSAGGPPSTPVAPPAASGGVPTGTDADGGASAPEAPVTRTVRIEVPARAASSRATGIDRLLRAADGVGASELFLVSQARPYVRVAGNVRALQDEAPLLPADIDALIADVTPEPWRDAVRRGDPAEWLIELVDVGRVRCSTFRDHRGPGANFHFAFLRAATADELQLSADTRLLATEPDGLVLVAGGPGSDRAAIVAAFVDILNHQRADYVITLEPQVRVLHVNREALISQREVGHEPSRVAAAVRAALRETPDALVIEGISTGEVAQLAIEAAADRLVIASIDAASTPAAVRRLLELVPIEQRQAARANLSRCFRGSVAQLMLRKSTGGRIAARELLTGTRVVSRLIGEGEVGRLAEALDAGSPAGTVPLADTIVEYVRAGLVDVREAVRKAPDAEDLVTRLGAAGVDLSALDRWN